MSVFAGERVQLKKYSIMYGKNTHTYFNIVIRV